MGYLVLARKYRPQRFEDVVKQEHITRALANAVTSGRLAHAILLSGPRGTGKTSIARILAKCVNCETGPTAVPCNTCRSCREITSSHAADVFEIDGASNNRVENIRELRENANYMPAHSPYKIYIIDEVHMLSDSAFNALLKILEEPPAHVKFFFATTDPNKIPITILSRCQRHDCRRVDIDSIINHMTSLCEKESIDISSEALTIIAREADGSIRDALSLLDLIITSATGRIEADLISDILGGLDRQSLFDISRAVFDRDAGKIIEIIGRLYDRGQNMTKLFSEILAHFRNLLVVKMGGKTGALSDVSEFEINTMREQVREIPQIYIHQVLDILFKEEATVRRSSSPRLAVEMAFIRIIQIRPALSMDTLIEKIDAVQKGIFEKLSTEDGSVKPLMGAAAKHPPPQKPASQDTPQDSAPESQEYPAAIENEDEAESEFGEDQLPDVYQEPMPENEPLEKSWKNILKQLAAENPALPACFSHSQINRTAPDQLEIKFKSNKFNISYVNREDIHNLIQSTCSRYFANDIQVTLSGEPVVSNNNTAKKKARLLESETLNHPLVADAMKIFNGRIVEIKMI